MKNTKIISAFPCCGKSYLYNIQDKLGLKILDSDSSNFSWVKDKDGNNTDVRNPYFPNNYIKHIKDNLGKADIIMVSSHDVVKHALKDNNLKYTLVYPNRNLKEEWLDRCRNRGSSESFVAMLDNNWNKFVDSCENDDTDKVILNSGEFIHDIIDSVKG